MQTSPISLSWPQAQTKFESSAPHLSSLLQLVQLTLQALAVTAKDPDLLRKHWYELSRKTEETENNRYISEQQILIGQIEGELTNEQNSLIFCYDSNSPNDFDGYMESVAEKNQLRRTIAVETASSLTTMTCYLGCENIANLLMLDQNCEFYLRCTLRVTEQSKEIWNCYEAIEKVKQLMNTFSLDDAVKKIGGRFICQDFGPENEEQLLFHEVMSTLEFYLDDHTKDMPITSFFHHFLHVCHYCCSLQAHLKSTASQQVSNEQDVINRITSIWTKASSVAKSSSKEKPTPSRLRGSSDAPPSATSKGVNRTPSNPDLPPGKSSLRTSAGSSGLSVSSARPSKHSNPTLVRIPSNPEIRNGGSPLKTSAGIRPPQHFEP